MKQLHIHTHMAALHVLMKTREPFFGRCRQSSSNTNKYKRSCTASQLWRYTCSLYTLHFAKVTKFLNRSEVAELAAVPIFFPRKHTAIERHRRAVACKIEAFNFRGLLVIWPRDAKVTAQCRIYSSRVPVPEEFLLFPHEIRDCRLPSSWITSNSPFSPLRSLLPSCIRSAVFPAVSRVLHPYREPLSEDL